MKKESVSALLEYLPLIVFLVVYFLSDIFIATGVLVVVSAITLSIQYFKLKVVSWINIVTVAMVILFGVLTIALASEQFIKMKLTILELILAVVLLVGLYFKKLFLKKLFVQSFHNLSDAVGYTLTVRLSFFFIGIAILNEIIWRTQTTDFWVLFKTVGVFVITLLFLLTQAPLLSSGMADQDSVDDNDEKE